MIGFQSPQSENLNNVKLGGEGVYSLGVDNLGIYNLGSPILDLETYPLGFHFPEKWLYVFPGPATSIRAPLIEVISTAPSEDHCIY